MRKSTVPANATIDSKGYITDSRGQCIGKVHYSDKAMRSVVTRYVSGRPSRDEQVPERFVDYANTADHSVI